MFPVFSNFCWFGCLSTFVFPLCSSALLSINMSTEPQSTAASVVESTKQAVAGAYNSAHDAIYPPPTAAENAKATMKSAAEATKDAAIGAKDVVVGAGQGVKEGFQGTPSE